MRYKITSVHTPATKLLVSLLSVSTVAGPDNLKPYKTYKHDNVEKYNSSLSTFVYQRDNTTIQFFGYITGQMTIRKYFGIHAVIKKSISRMSHISVEHKFLVVNDA